MVECRLGVCPKLFYIDHIKAKKKKKKIDGQSLKYAVGWMFEIPCDFNLKVITSFHQR